MLLKITNLSHSYHLEKTLDKISFSMKNGEIIAILGKSGSGKSTLLGTIAGLLEPLSGSIKLRNKEIQKPSDKLIAGNNDIRIVKQDYGLFPNMSLRENINYELRYFEEEYKLKTVQQLLEICEIDTMAERLPRQVSGGQQQRTAIAKAISQKPALLLLDEPFSHLDFQNKLKLKSIIQKVVRQEKIGCLFVTHEVEDALSLADRLIILENGKIIQEGSPEEIYNSPINHYVANLTGYTNIIAKNVLVRPENFDISTEENSDLKGILVKSSFIGRGYLNEIKLENKKSVQVFTIRKLTENEVFLKINRSSKLKD